MHFHKSPDQDAAIDELNNYESDVDDYAKSFVWEHWRREDIDKWCSTKQDNETREGEEGDDFRKGLLYVATVAESKSKVLKWSPNCEDDKSYDRQPKVRAGLPNVQLVESATKHKDDVDDIVCAVVEE